MLKLKHETEEEKQMAQHGQDANSKAGVKKDQGDNITLVRGSTSQSYLARRLRRDFPEIFSRLETYPSVRAAALEAGIVKPMIQHQPTVSGFSKAAKKHLSASQIEGLIMELSK